MSTVWLTDIQSPAAKLVLLSLADRANDDGRDCFPQIETIRKRCGLTYRGVTKVIKELEAAGHITIKSGRGKHRSNDFFVHPNLSSKWERGSYLRKRENGNKPAPKWEPDDTKMGTDEHENRNVVPTYTSVPIIEPSITTNGTAPIESANASSHFADGVDDDDELLARIRRIPTREVETAPPPPPPKEEDEGMTDEEWHDWRTMLEELIWAEYPKHRAKKELKSDFMRLIREEVKDDDLTAVGKGIKRWRKSGEWTKEGGRFCPSPLKFLDEEKWRLRPPGTESSSSSPL
jgi:hypothetical protein